MEVNINVFQSICLTIEASLDELIKALNTKINSEFGSGFALITDSEGNLVGVIQDSDLRKKIKSLDQIDLTVANIMRKDFISLEYKLTDDEMAVSLLKQISNRGWITSSPIEIIPVLDNGKPIRLMSSNEIENLLIQKSTNNIIIGLGYVGLTLAASLVATDRNVYGFDKNISKINMLLQSQEVIFEPGISKIFERDLNEKFFPIKDLADAPNTPGLRNVYYVCVDTPISSICEPDLTNIYQVIDRILNFIKLGDCVLMRSTVPIGTGNYIVSRIESEKKWKVGVDFHYISAPERTVEGNALIEIRELPQIIAGATPSCLALGLKLFHNISNVVSPVERIEEAELIKIAVNSYRDYTFAFSNSLIDICQKFNIDLNLLIKAANLGYPRSSIPIPSPGVGGPCLTKDSYFLHPKGLNLDKPPAIYAREVNNSIPKKTVKFIESKIKNLNEYKCIAVGLAFKGTPATDDVRNSTSVDFINEIKPYVKSIHIWDSTADLNSANFDFKKHKDGNSYNFYAILNNHIDNYDFVSRHILESSENQLLIYDPWRLLSPKIFKVPKLIKEFNYFSLSHHEVVNLR